MRAALEHPLDHDAASPRGDIVCRRVAGRSVLTRLWATDPLKLLSPRSNIDAAEVVMSSFGGGLLGGDKVGLRATVGPQAKLLLSTQSSSKVYRTTGRASVQSLDAVVEDDGLLVVLPDPLCAFAGARFHQRQSFNLAASANLIWLDWITSGRHGRGERWAMDEVITRATVNIDGRERLCETLTLDDGHDSIASTFRAGRFDCYAVLAVFGPELAEMAEAARQIVRTLDLSSPITLLAADSAVTGGAVFRMLGPDAQTVRALLSRLLRPLNDRIGGDPWARKW
jgi:urease accessory protein